MLLFITKRNDKKIVALSTEILCGLCPRAYYCYRYIYFLMRYYSIETLRYMRSLYNSNSRFIFLELFARVFLLSIAIIVIIAKAAKRKRFFPQFYTQTLVEKRREQKFTVLTIIFIIIYVFYTDRNVLCPKIFIRDNCDVLRDLSPKKSKLFSSVFENFENSQGLVAEIFRLI